MGIDQYINCFANSKNPHAYNWFDKKNASISCNIILDHSYYSCMFDVRDKSAHFGSFGHFGNFGNFGHFCHFCYFCYFGHLKHF